MMRLGVAIFIIGWLWFFPEALIVKNPSYPRQFVAFGLIGLGYYIAFNSYNKLGQMIEELSNDKVEDETIG